MTHFDQNPGKSVNVDLGIMIGIEGDGFRLKTGPKSPVDDGDTLLIAYKTNTSHWTRTSITYNDERDGMFVFTGDTPTNVVVMSHKVTLLSKSNRDVPVTVYSSDTNSGTSSCYLNDLLDPFNSFSPLSPLSAINPLAPFSLWRSETPHNFITDFESPSVKLPADDSQRNVSESAPIHFSTSTGVANSVESPFDDKAAFGTQDFRDGESTKESESGGLEPEEFEPVSSESPADALSPSNSVDDPSAY